MIISSTVFVDPYEEAELKVCWCKWQESSTVKS